jgi:hypothetical protein
VTRDATDDRPDAVRDGLAEARPGEPLDGLVVTTRHLFTVPGYTVRRGFCRAGARHWFESHGLDWREFARHGLAASVLEASGDAMALRVVQWARECAAKEHA